MNRCQIQNSHAKDAIVMENEEEANSLWKIIVSSVLFVVALLGSNVGLQWFNNQTLLLVWYGLTFLIIGLDVMREAWEYAFKRDYFSEYMLMTIACIGAFAIGKYPEAVAVMLLYRIGEALQDRSVARTRRNIQQLLAFKPTSATVIEDGKEVSKSPADVSVGDEIEVKAGERVPLDGVLLTNATALNTAALTGESLPRIIETGQEVMAGMIAVDGVLRLKVTRPDSQSMVSRILKMVEEASERKAPTELFIRRFAHIYTPIVIILAVFTVLFPYLFSLLKPDYVYIFSEWFRRSLIFLVISCPCALVISVPLGYFAGIGLASKRGILFKGSNFLDAITEIDLVMFDKTGTLTTGEFAVQSVEGLDEETIKTVASIEKSSNHPLAKAISRYCPTDTILPAKEIAGYGLQTDEWLIGNLKLLENEHVFFSDALKNIPETVVAVAKYGRYVGHFTLADTLKDDAKQAISSLPVRAEILSGDRQELVSKVASQLGVRHAYGDLLPEGKLEYIEKAQKRGLRVAFVGDGINDAPVLAKSNVGIAMGGLGSDMAIETADVIIQTDQPSKVTEAIAIGRHTRRIVNQNISLALGVKGLVMLLGVMGWANLWMAVFADSGIALLAVLNSARIFLYRK